MSHDPLIEVDALSWHRVFDARAPLVRSHANTLPDIPGAVNFLRINLASHDLEGCAIVFENTLRSSYLLRESLKKLHKADIEDHWKCPACTWREPIEPKRCPQCGREGLT